MNTLSRTITGIAAIALGTLLTIIALANNFFLLVYGLPALVIGVIILFNKKEDDIEQIKNKKDK